MYETSELGIVFANAPRLKKAFGGKRAAVITLIGFYFARRRPRLLGLFASIVVMAEGRDSLYFPFQFGVRLLRKASIPSRKSSLM